MSSFEDRLWEELVRDHRHELMYDVAGERRRRRVRRPALAAAAAMLAAALAAALLWLGGGRGEPAYAVSQHPDGTVTITIRRLVGVQGADAQLAQLGVPIRTVASEAACTIQLSRYTPDRVPAKRYERIRRLVGPGGAAVKVRPEAIPPGDTLLLSASRRSNAAVALRAQLYRGPAPPCLPLR